jgi:hypothetical protein
MDLKRHGFTRTKGTRIQAHSKLLHCGGATSDKCGHRFCRREKAKTKLSREETQM